MSRTIQKTKEIGVKELFNNDFKTGTERTLYIKVTQGTSVGQMDQALKRGLVYEEIKGEDK